MNSSVILQLSPKMLFSRKVSKSGITLIEVLTAVAVATIGVLGVLILIPLGSRFTETGFDRQKSRQLANNALSRFESYGFLDPSRWIFKASTNSDLDKNASGFVHISDSELGTHPGIDHDWVASPTINSGGLTGYCLDPMFVSAPNFFSPRSDIASIDNTQFGAGQAVRFFPFHTSGNALINQLRIPRLTISQSQNRNNPYPIYKGMATDIGAGDQSLSIATSNADETAPPIQGTLKTPGGNLAEKRDSGWNMTTFCLLFPVTDTTDKTQRTGFFRLISLVVKNRIFDTNQIERVFQVQMPDGSAGINTGGGFGELVLTEIDAPANAVSLKRNDWLILFPVGGGGGVDWANIRFAEVQQATLVDPSAGITEVTVSGDRFASAAGQQAIAVHVPGMIDYREKTVKLNVGE